MRIGIVVPHIFMHPDILPHVIFSPGQLALQLAEGLQRAGEHVTLFTPGPIRTTEPVVNVTADLSYFDAELSGRGDTYIDLLKKHAFTFVTLARQVQSELLAQAFAMANAGHLDVVHVYCNEEDIALPFARFCNKPVVFTHHDPFNFLVKYKNVFPKYAHLPWLSMSMAQRAGMPAATNWVANIYHGLDSKAFAPASNPTLDYLAYVGRIIQPKGVHVAIEALQQYNRLYPHQKLKLKIAGKHYSDTQKDTYWQEHVAPQLDDAVEYVGFIGDIARKNEFLANARALLVPSIFDEPFGMVSIEALASGTPVIALDSGALPEVVDNGRTGFVVQKVWQPPKQADKRELNVAETAKHMAEAIKNVGELNRGDCRADFEQRFTLDRMIAGHQAAYKKLLS